jgi:leucyl aminopeptidase
MLHKEWGYGGRNSKQKRHTFVFDHSKGMKITYDLKQDTRDPAPATLGIAVHPTPHPWQQTGPLQHWMFVDATAFYQKQHLWVQELTSVLKSWTAFASRKTMFSLLLDPAFLQHGEVWQRQMTLLRLLQAVSKVHGTATIYVQHEGEHQAWVQETMELCNMITSARDMALLPANLATPASIAANLKRMFRGLPGARVRIWTDGQLKRDGFGLLHAIGNSAANPPRFVEVVRPGKGKGGRTLCLVGKGITFDSGGLNLKSTHGMSMMKFDKIGAVYAAHALRFLMEDSSLVNHTLVGLFPLAENAVSERAIRPGDVIRSHSGKTVEITDTDAEGRLVLADAFSYARRLGVDVLIDIATLTHHAETINCWHAGYYYATPSWWKTGIERISERCGERMLAMPTWEDYGAVLASDVADLVNSPAKCSNAHTASLFLKEFLPSKCDWLHIDLANEFTTGIPQGRGMQTIIEAARVWLARNAHKK